MPHARRSIAVLGATPSPAAASACPPPHVMSRPCFVAVNVLQVLLSALTPPVSWSAVGPGSPAQFGSPQSTTAPLAVSAAKAPPLAHNEQMLLSSEQPNA